MVMLLTQLAHVQASLGHLTKARASANAALEAASCSQRSFDIMLGSYVSGVVELYGGDLTTAIPDLERGLIASTMESAQSMHVSITSLLGCAYLCAGRGVDALAVARRALSVAETSLYHANWPRLFGGIILVANGFPEEALRLVTSARVAARKGNYRVQLVWCDLVLAQLYSANNAAAALRHLAQARSLSEEIGLRPCLVRALVETAHLRQKVGMDDDVERLLQQAAKLSRMMGLRWTEMANFGAIASSRSSSPSSR